MVVPWLVLLAALCTFLLGVFVWDVFEHFLTTGVPSTLQHPAKFRSLHCMFLYMVTLVSLYSGPVMGWGTLSLSLSALPLLSIFHLPSLSLFRLPQERQTLL